MASANEHWVKAAKAGTPNYTKKLVPSHTQVYAFIITCFISYPQLQDLLLLDVTPLTIGFSDGKSTYDVIPRNSTIPTKKTVQYTYPFNLQNRSFFSLASDLLCFSDIHINQMVQLTAFLVL